MSALWSRVLQNCLLSLEIFLAQCANTGLSTPQCLSTRNTCEQADAEASRGAGAVSTRRQGRPTLILDEAYYVGIRVVVKLSNLSK